MPAESAPEKGTGPKDAAAVSCSERCRRGLPPASSISGVSKFGGSRSATLGAEASGASRSLHRYHQAMSCGLTRETVAHHGSSAPAWAYHSANWRVIFGSTRQPWPGAPSGEGWVPPENPYRSSAWRPCVAVHRLSWWVRCHFPYHQVL